MNSTITPLPISEHTDITIVLDASGSMKDHAAETVASINSYIAEQAAQPGTATMSIWRFSSHDNLCEVMHRQPLKDADGKVATLDSKLYQPDGMTALTQATSHVMDTTGARYAAEDAAGVTTDKRIFVIVTDGHENDSKGEHQGEEGRARLKAKIEHQTKKYGWNFVFLAANMDAKIAGATLGIQAKSCLEFATRSGEVTRGYGGLSAYTSVLRGS